MKQVSLFVSALMLALLVFGVSQPAWAQETTPEATDTAEATPETTDAAPEGPQPITYNTPVTGRISASAFTQDWTLSTASADRVQVRVTRTGGNLLPDVSILNASGSAIAQAYGPDQTSAAALINDFTLPERGTYTVQVGRYSGESGDSTGAYTLEVIPLGTAADNPNNRTVIGELELETPVTGELTAARWQNLYTYTSDADDTIQVVVRRTDGTLMPLVNVLDANNTVLRTGYNEYATADTGEFDLPGGGTYTIAVSRYNEQDGDTLGRYEVSVHLIASGEGSARLEGTAGTLTYGEPARGLITAARWYEDWEFTAEAGDTLSLVVERADGDLIPEVTLLGGSMQELRRGFVDNSYARAEISRYELDGAGRYTVRVTRYIGKTGDTTGAYTLTARLDGTGEDNPALNEPVGEITLGEAVEGEVTSALWQNVWTFEGEEDSVIAITVKRLEGTLTPLLEIRDANNQRLNSTYYVSTRDSAEITRYTVPSSGEYRVVVIRDGGERGYTAGSYTLTINESAE